jgi:hypothetical protein
MNCSSTNSLDIEYAPGVEWTRILYVKKFDFTIHNEFELDFSIAFLLFNNGFELDFSMALSLQDRSRWTLRSFFFFQEIVTTGDRF